MIIQALHRYYQILAEDEKSQIPLYGYCKAKVGYALNISEEGELLDIFPLKEENKNGKKLIPKIFTVPEQKVRASNISANFMCDNCTYVLGIDNKSESQRLEEKFKSFKELHYQVLGCAKGRAAKAVLAFLEKWNISKAKQNKVLLKYIEDILKGSNLVFRLYGEMGYLHDDLEIKKLWEEYNSKNRENDIESQCLVTGETTILSKIHPKITNIKGTFSGGASIVSFNDQAYASFGKEQNYNAPIGKYAAFTYTTVLKYMLSNVKHKIQIGDATTVFWAESPQGIYPDFAAELLNPALPKNEKDESDKQSAYEHDTRTESLVRDVLSRAKLGKKINDLIDEIDMKTKFYILGLSPNAGRISVRFFYSDTFGGFVEKIAQHYKDMELVKDFNDRPDNIPIWMMLKETVSQKSREKKVMPLLAGAVMRSIITGGMYPQSLYYTILQRIKMDTDSEKRVNYIRASIIKAYLIRKFNITKNYNLKEVLTVALNEQITNIAGLLGRLFAVLEKAQKDAGNETIRARYFASAMTTPKVVYPILLRLAQHHISKIKFGPYYDEKIENIIKEIDYFPSYLSLDEQGVFILGYYHQRIKLWEKQIKENINLKEEN